MYTAVPDPLSAIWEPLSRSHTPQHLALTDWEDARRLLRRNSRGHDVSPLRERVRAVAAFGRRCCHLGLVVLLVERRHWEGPAEQVERLAGRRGAKRHRGGHRWRHDDGRWRKH